MMEKWKREWSTEDGEDFCRYFSSTFRERFSVWSEGQDILSPSTNNGPEAFNGEIKRQHTLRERQPVGQFLVLSLNMVPHWSRDCETRTAFARSPTISLSLHTKAFQWTNGNKVLLTEDDACKTIYIPAGTSTELATFSKITSLWLRKVSATATRLNSTPSTGSRFGWYPMSAPVM